MVFVIFVWCPFDLVSFKLLVLFVLLFWCRFNSMCCLSFSFSVHLFCCRLNVLLFFFGLVSFQTFVLFQFLALFVICRLVSICFGGFFKFLVLLVILVWCRLKSLCCLTFCFGVHLDWCCLIPGVVRPFVLVSICFGVVSIPYGVCPFCCGPFLVLNIVLSLCFYFCVWYMCLQV